ADYEDPTIFQHRRAVPGFLTSVFRGTDPRFRGEGKLSRLRVVDFGVQLSLKADLLAAGETTSSAAEDQCSSVIECNSQMIEPRARHFACAHESGSRSV